MPALDYSNLPLLLTTKEAAALYRVSVGQLRTLRREKPGWLEPVPAFAGRSKLFARADVLAAAGLAPWPEPAPTLQDLTIEEAAAERSRQRKWQLAEARMAGSAARRKLADDHPQIQRADRLALLSSFIKWVSTDNHDFTFWLYWQPRFRPAGWPARIDLPRVSPGSVIRLDEDRQAAELRSEIEEILAVYQPLWETLVADRRADRQAPRKPMR